MPIGKVNRAATVGTRQLVDHRASVAKPQVGQGGRAASGLPRAIREPPMNITD